MSFPKTIPVLPFQALWIGILMLSWPIVRAQESRATERVGRKPLAAAESLVAGEYKGWTYGSDRAKKKIDCSSFIAVVVESLCAAAKVDCSKDLKAAIKVATIDYKREGERLKIALPDRKVDDKPSDFSAREKEWKRVVLDRLVEEKNVLIRGSAGALITAGYADPVERKDLAPGDFVQYWYKDGDHFSGHSGIIRSVDGERIVLYGSHATILASADDPTKKAKTGGLGPTIPFKLPKDHVFAARWKL